MSVVEVGMRVPSTPEELFALIGEPAEGAAEPFDVVVITRSRWRKQVETRKGPIGLYRLPVLGEVLVSEWPAVFRGPFTMRNSDRWELRTSNGKLLVADKISGCGRGCELVRGDTVEITVRLRGEP